MRHLVPLLLAISLGSAADLGPVAIGRPLPPPAQDTAEAIAGMAGNPSVRALFAPHQLDVVSLTWEDTGRSKQSCWGPNISDLTIQLQGRGPAAHGWCMPVVRYANFADRSCDVPIGSLKLLVGNERGGALSRVDLRAYLERFSEFQPRPTGWLKGSLLAARDQAVLTSAQACLLPVPAGGETTFAPVLFNYQSEPGAPAVLVIMATPEGTSAQVITNGGEAASGVWHGQRLFHDRAGERAPLVASRFSDRMRIDDRDSAAIAGGAANRDGLSLVLVIQVPLKQPVRALRKDVELALEAPAACANYDQASRSARGMETAVIAAGPVEGPWLGLAGCTIERDERFPIRATVQFYQATDSATPSPADAQRLARAIERVYLDADAVGSLVVDGATARPTEHHVPPATAWPQPWWQAPCEAYAARWNEPWRTAVDRVRARLGADWQPADARELRNALELARP